MLTEKMKQTITRMVGEVLAEQARAAEQGQDEYSLAQPSPLRYVPSFTTGGTVPTQPPAGDAQMVRDVVDNMRRAYDKHAPKGEEARHPGMAAALAVAREGYVSLKNAETAIREEATRVLYGPKAAEGFLADVRARLKPAERVTVMRSDFDPFDQVSVWLDGKEECCNLLPLHAERYAAGLRQELRDGKEGK